MILSLIIHRELARLNLYLKDIIAILLNKIHFRNYAKHIADFIWNIFKKFFAIRNAYSVTFVIDADINSTAMSICKTANPFEIFITP